MTVPEWTSCIIVSLCSSPKRPGSGPHDTAHYSMSGCGPDNFDPLTAMDDWVEKGKAPDSLLAKQYERKLGAMGAPADYSKPGPDYSGHGEVKDAANCSCPATDTSS
jgi:feruloyl esterase